MQVQLIKKTEVTLYKKDGLVLSLTPEQKLLHNITGGEMIQMNSEEIITRWYNIKRKKDIDTLFWDFIKNNKIEDWNNYYTIITK